MSKKFSVLYVDKGEIVSKVIEAKERGSDLCSIHAPFTSSNEEEGKLYIPLGSDILYNSCNYAAQEIERIKFDNLFMSNMDNTNHLNNFLNIF